MKSVFTKKKNIGIVATVLSICIIYFSIFYFYPIFKGIIGSLFEWNPFLSIFNFIGLHNYQRILMDPRIVRTIINTFAIGAVRVVFTLVFGLLIALGISSTRFFKTFLRTSYFLPYIVTLPAIALIWKFMLDSRLGVINDILSAIGLPFNNFPWLLNSNTAPLGIMMVNVWQGTGFAVVIFLAALSSIPRSLIEASRIDGANPIQVFFSVKLPLMLPSVFYLVILNTITSLQIFAEPLLMPEYPGGPDGGTRTILIIIIEEAFLKMNFGYAAAMTQVLFIIILVISLIQFFLLKRNWKL